jgi:N-acetylmuramoyl-L-alanine amidase
MSTVRTSRTPFAAAFLILLAAIVVAVASAYSATQAQAPPQGEAQSAPGQTPPGTAPDAAPAIPSQTPSGAPPPPPPTLVILDPAHGGADSGAHGGAEEGVMEKDLVLAIAQVMRRDLERQGIRVVLTRQGDTAISIDDRAALANALGGGFFVSLHVGSTGDANTAQAYSFGTPAGGAPPAFVPKPIGLEIVRWDDAQSAYAVPSRRLAELVQVELAQKLRGSADVPLFAELRQLRVVAHPAVAIELSNVGEENAAALEKTAAPLAAALARALAAYRQPGEARP